MPTEAAPLPAEAGAAVAGATAAFRACGHRSLSRLGLGRAWVDAYLGPASLILVDADDGRVDIPFDAVDRVRFGYDTERFGARDYEMRVWANGARRPLFFLHIFRDASPGFAGVARGLATAVAARRGIGAVEGGLGWTWAILCAGFVAWISGYCAWATIQSWREGEPMWIVLIFPPVALIMGGLIGYAVVRNYCPRRLGNLDQLDRFVGA
jgi:hypothetical protein